jgi:DNA invertase Pin-like site-specific DNA recombinase
VSKKRGRKPVSAAVRADILRLGESTTLTVQQIAYRVGLSGTTVRRYLPIKYWRGGSRGESFKKIGNRMCHSYLAMDTTPSEEST